MLGPKYSYKEFQLYLVRYTDTPFQSQSYTVLLAEPFRSGPVD